MRARRAELMEMQAEISMHKNRALVGRELEVLVEGPADDSPAGPVGRLASQAPEIDGAVFLGGSAAPGQFVRARVDRAMTYDVSATIIESIQGTRSTYHA
jgi:ribosomal protein S12 methylthiotransferase